MTDQDVPRFSFLTTLATFKVVGIPLASIIDAVPEGLLAAAFLRGLLWPEATGSTQLQWLFQVMLIEFLVVHSTGFVGAVVVADASRRLRIEWVLGFSAFYFLFAGGMALGFHSWFPVVALAGLTLNRLLFILLRDPASITPLTGNDINNEWAFGVAAYLLSMIAVVLLLPKIEQYLWSPEVHSQYFWLQGNMSGQLDVPIAAGIFYFTARTVRALFFSRALGKPGYLHDDAPLTETRVLGIHVGLWYILLRMLGLFLFATAFLSSAAYLSQFAIPLVIMGFLIWAAFAAGFVATCVNLRMATLMIVGAGQP